MAFWSSPTFMRDGWSIFLVLATFGVANGQQNVHHKDSVLIGRVYATTGGTILKPAASADIYLLLLPEQSRDNRDVDGGETAGSIYLKEEARAIEVYKRKLGTDPTSSTGTRACTEERDLLQSVLLKTVIWAQAHKESQQIVTTQADEDGSFGTSLQAGTYIVVARGGTESTAPFWIAEPPHVTVKHHARVKLKLSFPSQSCSSG